ncbi:MAG: hypothetical protein ABI690_09785 [Chloroflexota bacterium]
MGALSVLFEVPAVIEQGLATGNLQRIGGVIVDSASRQVVAWLRDGSSIGSVTDAVGSSPTPLGIIMTAAKMGATLWDGKTTRKAIQGVSQQVAGLSGQMQQVTTLASFTATGQVLNLALSAATFHATMERLERLTQEVAQLGEVVRAEFARDRDIQFRTALEAARDALESESSHQRENANHVAQFRLLEAMQQFLTDFETALEGEITEQNLLIAQHALTRALYAEASRIRCYAAVGEAKLAKQKLKESLVIFHEKSRQLVTHWLGKYPSIFFHPEVPSLDLERFFQLQRWLHDDDLFSTADDAKILFQILNDMRGDFWNQRVIEDEYADTFTRIARRPAQTFKDRIAKQINHLSYAEIIVENYQRLLGFDLELRSVRLSFDEWNRFVPEQELAEHGIGIIIDSDLLDDAQHRLTQ